MTDTTAPASPASNALGINFACLAGIGMSFNVALSTDRLATAIGADDSDFLYGMIASAIVSLLCAALCCYAHKINRTMLNTSDKALDYQKQLDSMLTSLCLLLLIPSQTGIYLMATADLAPESSEITAISMTIASLYLMKHTYQYARAQLQKEDNDHDRKYTNSYTLFMSLFIPTCLAFLGSLIGAEIHNSATLGKAAGLFLGMAWYGFGTASPYAAGKSDAPAATPPRKATP